MRSVFSLFLVVVIAAAGCLGGNGKQASPSASPSTAAGSNATAAKEMYVVATDVSSQPTTWYRFSKSAYTFKANDKINVTLKNAVGDINQHALIIDEFNVKLENVAVSDSKSVIFTATKAGTFKFYCNVGNHRTLGMEGTLTIS